MSYCRWSCDKFQSDVYVYEDCMEGYTIHVANKHPISVEHVPQFDIANWIKGGADNFIKKNTEYTDAVKKIEYKEIGLPYDDQTFRVDSLEELHETLVYLRDTGYYVPEKVFDMIGEEISK